MTDSCLLQVNSDVVFYTKDKYGNMSPYKVDTTLVGQCVCTKAVGSSDLVDITQTYKHQEGTTDAKLRFLPGLKPPPVTFNMRVLEHV